MKQFLMFAVVLLLLTAVPGCGAVEIPPPADVTKALTDLSAGAGDVSIIKQKIVAGLDDAGLTKLCAQAKPEERNLLMVLYLTRQSVDHGMTDGDLKSAFEDNAVVKSAVAAFAKPELQKLLLTLESQPAEQAKNLAVAISSVWYDTGGPLPDGAPFKTWAAGRMRTALQNCRMVELAKVSTVVKLLVADKQIELPTEAKAVFDWSHDPSVTIALPAPKFEKGDLEALTRLKANPAYAEAAAKALEQLK